MSQVSAVLAGVVLGLLVVAPAVLLDWIVHRPVRVDPSFGSRSMRNWELAAGKQEGPDDV